MIRYIFFPIVLFLYQLSFCQENILPLAYAGPKGNFVYLGKEIPNGMLTNYYQVERRPRGGKWDVIANTKLSDHKGEFARRIHLYKSILPLAGFAIADTSALFEKTRLVPSIDSLGVAGYQLPIRLALGNMFYDDQVDRHVWYQYRITNVSPNGTGTQYLSDEIKMSGWTDFNALQLYEQHWQEGDVYVKWYSVGFEPAPYARSFVIDRDRQTTELNQAAVYSIGDTTYYVCFQKGMGRREEYQFFLSPADAYGNAGHPSEMALFHPNLESEPGFMDIHAEQLPGTSFLKLDWTLNAKELCKAVIVYRSKQFDGIYEKLTQVTPATSSYIDTDVFGDQLYFYQLEALHTSSPMQTRSMRFFDVGFDPLVPAPPAIEGLTYENGKYRLVWSCDDPAAYGARLYAVEEGRPDTALIHDLVSFRGDSAVFILEDHRFIAGSNYHITARTVNHNEIMSSYAEFVYLQIPTFENDVIPSGFVGWYEDDGVHLHWDNLLIDHPTITGYVLYKTDGEGRRELSLKDSLQSKNYFIDKMVRPGQSITYSLNSVDGYHNVSGYGASFSLEIPEMEMHTPQISRVMQIGAGTAVIEWQENQNEMITHLEIHRAVIGQKPEPVKTIQKGDNQWIDNGLSPGLYIYTIAGHQAQGNEVISSRAVSVRITE